MGLALFAFIITTIEVNPVVSWSTENRKDMKTLRGDFIFSASTDYWMKWWMCRLNTVNMLIETNVFLWNNLCCHYSTATKLIKIEIDSYLNRHCSLSLACLLKLKCLPPFSLLWPWPCRHAASGWMRLCWTDWGEILPLHTLQPNFGPSHDHQTCPELWPHLLLLCK